jgi:hypothetical protein
MNYFDEQADELYNDMMTSVSKDRIKDKLVNVVMAAMHDSSIQKEAWELSMQVTLSNP